MVDGEEVFDRITPITPRTDEQHTVSRVAL
jgi:hypothetical protein